MAESSFGICELEIDSLIQNFPQIRSWAEKCWLDSGFPVARMSEMLVALEEVYANVCSHGYAGAPGPVKFQCCRGQDNSIIYTIKDWSVPFDVAKADAPDIKSGLSDRKIGGLGVLLIKEMADEIEWSYEDHSNTLSLKFRLVLQNDKS